MNSRMLGDLIKDYLIDNPSGGNCHLVLGDLNARDSDISFCMEQCVEKNDTNGTIIMMAMIRMKKTARLKSIDNGYKKENK